MSLLAMIDNCKTFEEIKDAVENDINILHETDEHCNALSRAIVNLDVRLVYYLLSFDIDWQLENIFCYSMCAVSYLYPNFNNYQKEKCFQIFNKVASLLYMSSDNLTRCFEGILSRGNIYLLQLFVEAGYLDTRAIPDCDALIYYRLKYFKELRVKNKNAISLN